MWIQAETYILLIFGTNMIPVRGPQTKFAYHLSIAARSKISHTLNLTLRNVTYKITNMFHSRQIENMPLRNVTLRHLYKLCLGNTTSKNPSTATLCLGNTV